MNTVIDHISLQIACVKREIGFRERVYPRWVAAGKMTQAKADKEIEMMREVQATLETLVHVLDWNCSRVKKLTGG